MKIAFIAADTPQAQETLQAFEKRYGAVPVADADAIVTLGGDGVVLNAFYQAIDTGKPVFAIRRTNHVGFLCNDYRSDSLPERIAAAQKVVLHPLRVDCETTKGARSTALAINEVTMLRDSPQSAKLRVIVDGIERLACFSGDGLMVATPAGSPAYNHSAGGPIMPLDANTLVMTAISGFRPRRWSYAVLPQDSIVDIEAQQVDKRPVRIEAGPHTVHGAIWAKIRLDRSVSFTLLFDPDQHLSERIVQEQFMM